MARGLDQILRELDASYSPQRQSINDRLASLPAQADAEIEGLKGQQTQAFDDILAGARNRGLGFSGVPISEQAKYTSSQFLPAVARVRQSQNENQRSLSDALNNINMDQTKYAQSIYQTELDREQQERQFQQQLAEQRRAATIKEPPKPTLKDPTLQPKAFYSLKNPNNPAAGYNFTDASGQPISAVAYANLTGTPLSQLVKRMADSGDEGAKRALPYTRDSGFIGRGVLNSETQNLLRSLGWQ